jgi:hypothetical protein
MRYILQKLLILAIFSHMHVIALRPTSPIRVFADHGVRSRVAMLVGMVVSHHSSDSDPDLSLAKAATAQRIGVFFAFWGFPLFLWHRFPYVFLTFERIVLTLTVLWRGVDAPFAITLSPCVRAAPVVGVSIPLHRLTSGP